MVLLVLLAGLLLLLDLGLALLGSELECLAGENPALVGFAGLLDGLVAGLGGDIHEEEGVADKVALDELVEGGVGGEGGRVVDLQQVDLPIGVHHEVKAEDLEAHVVGQVVGLGTAVLVLQVWLSTHQGLDDDVLNVRPVLVRLEAQGLESLEELGQRLLVAVAEVVQGLIVHVLGTVLVDGVVGEMHAQVVHVLLVRELVLLGGEAHQSLVVDVDAQGVAAGHQGIYAHVELEALVQEGVGNVLLNDAVLIVHDLWIRDGVPVMSWVRKIPRPWQLASGLTMKVFWMPRFLIS